MTDSKMVLISSLLVFCLLIGSSPVVARHNPELPRTLFTDPEGGTGGGPIAGTLTVTVVMAGSVNPIAGAFVMAGSAPDDPFPENYGFTGTDGRITLSDPGLTGPIDVTAGAAEYQLFTFFSVNASDIVVPLSRENTSTEYQIGDYVSGIEVDNGTVHYGDGYVDMAFVMPTLNLDEITTLDMNNYVGPMEEITIFDQVVEIPSNVFLPQQWELFVEITKDHYYLYLPAGNYTLYAMSGRIPVDQMMDIMEGGGDFMDILPYILWREGDILDISVSGGSLNYDFNLNQAMSSTVTIHLGNVPPDSKAVGMSSGDLDGSNGTGRIIPLGFNSLDCPPGNPCSGNISLTTLAATGEFAGMGYFSGAAVQMNATNDVLAILDRQDHAQTYSSNLSVFFNLLNLAYFNRVYSWNDVENTMSGSPDVAAGAGQITDVQTSETIWNYMIPGSVLSLIFPTLPETAPEGLVPGRQYTWNHSALGLGFELPSFDFNSFSFTDISDHLSHLAVDSLEITAQHPNPTPTPTAPPGEPTHTPVLPSSTPSATPTTAPGQPTNTPIPPSPTPYPTPPCDLLGCKINMPSNDFGAGDIFYCDVSVCNPGSTSYAIHPVFVILEIDGSYFFAPDFSDFNYYEKEITPGNQTIQVIPGFTWPDNAGSYSGAVWYAAMTDMGVTQLFGDMDMITFGWH